MRDVGAARWILKGIVETDARTTVQRLSWIQFDSYLLAGPICTVPIIRDAAERGGSDFSVGLPAPERQPQDQ